MKYTRSLAALSLFLVPTLAHAHPGHAGHEVGGIGWGLVHPFTGLDHILAMVAVGLWAVQRGGRSLWALPLTFVAAMALGGVLGMQGLQLPMVEPLVVASVLALGAMVAFSARLPMAASAAIVAVSALFHGQAHGAEMPANGAGWMTVLGFVSATAALHALGILGGLGMQRVARSSALRMAGAAICAGAVLIAFGVL